MLANVTFLDQHMQIMQLGRNSDLTVFDSSFSRDLSALEGNQMHAGGYCQTLTDEGELTLQCDMQELIELVSITDFN